MAAGDVTVTGDAVLPNGLRLMVGTVVLDGGNPTPVTLTTYMSSVLFGMATMDGSAATGDDPNYVTSNVSATTLNIYAWKNTSGTDPTMIASTDNARLIDWLAIGTTPSAARA